MTYLGGLPVLVGKHISNPAVLHHFENEGSALLQCVNNEFVIYGLGEAEEMQFSHDVPVPGHHTAQF